MPKLKAYPVGLKLLLDNEREVRFIGWTRDGTTATIFVGGKVKQVSASRIRKVNGMRKWEIGMEVKVLIRDHCNGTTTRTWLEGQITDINKNGPVVRVTSDDPVWFGCQLERGDYSRVQPK